ncbi:MAG: ExeA family protein [Gammaproteobacteria bacterium]
MYQMFYKLRGKPFQLTPDPGLLFPSRGHKRAMSYLLYGFEQGEGFVMITGAVGTGKTLLIQTLFEKLAHRHIAMASIASANLDGPDILPAVASAFELPYEGRSKEALLQDVKRHLVSLCPHHTHALLVVDEAQTLTPAALEMLRILSNLEIRGQALLQVFLVGQTELRRTIVSNHMEQLRQRIIASYRLEPMPLEESQAYILHRLRAVGWKADPEFSLTLFPKVHRASGGIPRKINLIMDRLLLYGYLEELHQLDEGALATVLAEIGEETTGMPATLEAPVSFQSLDMARAAAASEKENQLAVMELKLNDILRQMREKIRLKEMLQSGNPAADASEGAVISSTRHLRSKREGK